MDLGEERYSLEASGSQRLVHVWKELLLMPGVVAVSGDGPNLRQLAQCKVLVDFKSNFNFTSKVVLY